MAGIIPAHLMTKTITERAIDPAHAHRRNTKEFRAAKRRLKQDGHYRCWICGTERRIEVHHRGVEWMYAAIADFGALKEFCEESDPYGYGHLLRHRPITTVDDIRNLLCLCRAHHVLRGTGWHETTGSWWLMQKLALPGKDPVQGVST